MKTLWSLVGSLLVILAISAMTAWLVWDSVTALPFLYAVGCGALYVLSSLRTRDLRRRDRLVRAMVVRTFECDGRMVGAEVLVRALATPDVVNAWGAARLREEQLLVERYANGEASDF